jgi:hypothetical protein
VGDGDHRRIEDVDLAGDHGLDREHYLAGDRYRIEREVRHRRVAAPSHHVDEDLVRGGEQGAALGRDHARGDVRALVDGEGEIDPTRDVEDSFVDHEPGAVLSLLAGLEHEHHPALQFVDVRPQQRGGARQHGDVRVMAARVRRSGVGAREVEAGVLGHRQRVHVASKQHRGSRSAGVQYRHDARERPAAGDAQAQALERGEDGALGARKLQPELGVGVDVPAQSYRRREQGLSLGEQRGVRIHPPRLRSYVSERPGERLRQKGGTASGDPRGEALTYCWSQGPRAPA